ncbi:CysS/YqeB C-terminal domain-containing protein [Enemella sp. A6]
MGAADDARDHLRALGIAVRDRDDIQQYREIPSSEQ